MTHRLLAIIVSLWLSLISGLSAQVGFTLPFLNDVSPGTTLVIPVTVTNFDSIVSSQFVIQWDPAVLDFGAILTYNLPGMNSEDFGLADTASGILRFAYEAPSLSSGVSKSDGSTIFRMSFYVKGEVNDGTALTFSGLPPTEFEVIQAGHPAALTIDSCALVNGFVAVGYTVATAEPGTELLPVTIFPNPFFSAIQAVFDLKTSETVQIVLTDAAGKQIEEKKISLPAGQHGMEIASDQLQENGIYYLIIRTATQTCIRSLVKF